MAHAGGRITQKVIDGFNGIKSQSGNIFTTIQDKDFCDYFLSAKDDDYKLFYCDYSLGDILRLDNSSLNFFRMFCVFTIEALVEQYEPQPQK